jgi:hypothetical protein
MLNNSWLFSAKGRILWKRTVAPRLATAQLRRAIYSQGGNILFPGWECFVPKVGMQRHTLTLVRE